MDVKLLSISSMYPGYLSGFYAKNPQVFSLPYQEHLGYLLDDSTEYVSSYNKNFRRAGIDASCVITNDKALQNKWIREHGKKNASASSVLLEQVKHYKPDILWVENLAYTDSEWLRNVKNQVKSIRLVAGYHCAPLGTGVRNAIGETDLIFTCTPGLKQYFESLGKRSVLVYHAFDPDFLGRIKNLQINSSCNLLFSGSLFTGGEFHNERIRLIERLLAENIDIGLYVNLEKGYRIRIKQGLYMINRLLQKIGLEDITGKIELLKRSRTPVISYSDSLIRSAKPPLYGIEMYNLLSNASIALNYHIGIAGNYAGNMRLFESTGVGTCLLTDNKVNLTELFEPGQEIAVYDSPEECFFKAKYLLENDSERKKIAISGQQRTLKEHTVFNRCLQIREILQNELKIARVTV